MPLKIDIHVASICLYLMWNPQTKAFPETMQSPILHFHYTKINLTFPKFPDKLILRESKQLFYQNHWTKLSLSVRSRIQSWEKINLILSHRDFAENTELRHTLWQLAYKKHTVNCKYHITKLLASGCRFSFFSDRPFMDGFGRTTQILFCNV